MAVALYMQHVMGLNPCYLCITQRVMVMTVGVTALVWAVHGPGKTGRKIYGALVVVLAATGGFFSSRQLWLQSLPEDQVPACGPPADYLFEVFSLGEALSMLLKGDGNCAEVQWSFLGLSIPGWTLIGFVFIAGLALWQVFRKS